MDDESPCLIDIGQLRRGMYIQLELGWMDHPFPRGSFKISSEDQIRTIRKLGLSQVRYIPAKSDPPERAWQPGREASPPQDFVPSAGMRLRIEGDALREQRRQQLLAQQSSLRHCERRFNEAVQLYQRVLDDGMTRPVQMREQCTAMVAACVAEILVDGEAAIRLLSEGDGDRLTTHPVNVMVVSLLLGRALGLPVQQLTELGLAALLHDLGKTQLPSHLRYHDESLDAQAREIYRSHVEASVQAARRMGLGEPALTAIGQHHEMADGSGFPQQLHGAQLSIGGKVLALVDTYDRLCHPPRLVQALTPHEALSLMFAHHKARFDPVVLGAFIRMMGVYPPGSLVQLVNDRYALVVSVNAGRPLKPRVLVYDPAVAPEQTLILDLEAHADLGIRRSLKPLQLPAAVRAHLAPRLRARYFYEHQPATAKAVEA